MAYIISYCLVVLQNSSARLYVLGHWDNSCCCSSVAYTLSHVNWNKYYEVKAKNVSFNSPSWGEKDHHRPAITRCDVYHKSPFTWGAAWVILIDIPHTQPGREIERGKTAQINTCGEISHPPSMDKVIHSIQRKEVSKHSHCNELQLSIRINYKSKRVIQREKEWSTISKNKKTKTACKRRVQPSWAAF